MDNDIVTRTPVDRCSNTMLVGQLEGVHHSQKFRSVSTGRGWVGEDKTDSLFGVDNEYRADSKGHAFTVHVRGILVIKPVNVSSNIPYLVGAVEYHMS